MDIQQNKNWRKPKLSGQDNDRSFKKAEPHRFFPAAIFYQDKNISVLTPLGNWRIFSQFAYLVSCSWISSITFLTITNIFQPYLDDFEHLEDNGHLDGLVKFFRLYP